jgi:exosortase/archaeosortase family protein
MAILPVVAAVNSFMTLTLDKSGWYRPIQKYIVPFQSRMVVTAIKPFGINSKAVTESSVASFFMIKNGAAIPVDLSWNCLGWQSALLLIVSLYAGLSGSYSKFSRFLCVIFGLFGTLLINIFRMSLIAIGIYYVNALTGKIVHDYLAAFFTIIWLMLFWWFSYKYILINKPESCPVDTIS